MNRKEQIETAAYAKGCSTDVGQGFITGAEWADSNPVKPMDILNKILDHSQERAMAWTKISPAPATQSDRLIAALEKGLDFVAQMKDQIRTLPGEVDTFEEMAREALKDANE